MSERKRDRLTIALLALVLSFSTGCLFRSHRVPITRSLTPLKVAARDQLVARVNAEAARIQSMNATVDIDAQHVVRRPDQNINVSVHIGGTLYTPRLTLSSDIRPPLPETEVISLLLFGTSSGQALAQGGGNPGLLNTAVSTVSSYATGLAAAAVSSQIEQSLITDLGVPLDFLQIRPGDVAGGQPLTGTQIAVCSQIAGAKVRSTMKISGTSTWPAARMVR